MDNGGNHPTEILNGMDPSNQPLFALTLRIGQPIVLIRDMDAK